MHFLGILQKYRDKKQIWTKMNCNIILFKNYFTYLFVLYVKDSYFCTLYDVYKLLQ